VCNFISDIFNAFSTDSLAHAAVVCRCFAQV